MSCCDTPRPEKACSGKCRSVPLIGMPRLWIVAACQKKAMLFARNASAQLQVVESSAGSDDLESTCRYLAQSRLPAGYEHLVLVGTKEELATLQHMLAPDVSALVVAEIIQPLQDVWGYQAEGAPALKTKLEQLLH